MGWKNVKEHYRIGHIVQVAKAGLCIGSPYIHDIIVVSPEGKLIKKERSTRNEDLLRYQSEIEASPDEFARLFQEPDKFERSLSVWTFKGAEIIEKHCEEYGWPNICHDGQIIDSDFCRTKEDAIRAALGHNKAHIRWTVDTLKQARERLAEILHWRAEARANIKALLKMQNQEQPPTPS